MIYDIYDLTPGSVPAYMQTVKGVALPAREDQGIKLAGWYTTDVGTAPPRRPHLGLS